MAVVFLRQHRHRTCRRAGAEAGRRTAGEQMAGDGERVHGGWVGRVQASRSVSTAETLMSPISHRPSKPRQSR